MKLHYKLTLLCLTGFLLSSCAVYHKANTNTADLADETWPHSVASNPMSWTRGSDRWFLKGDPNTTEVINRSSPATAAISTMIVKVPDFHRIKIAGAFQVQIFGTEGHNSVTVYGPNVGVRQAAVFVAGDTLNVNQVQSALDISHVIVRIGIANLQGLSQMGPGMIEGRQVVSDGLDLKVYGSGDVYLAGQIKLREVRHFGCGKVSVFGVKSLGLNVYTNNSGTLNLTGDVGLRFIAHRGTGNINIIGARSTGLKIDSAGSGKIGLNGEINIRSIVTRGDTCVYAFCVNSDSLNVILFDNSHVGLVGATKSIFVDAAGTSQFEGRSLRVADGSVRAHEQAHINVTGREKMFASATGSSSVYFYGPSEVLEAFTENSGVVIPVWPDNSPNAYICAKYPFCATSAPVYKDAPPSGRRWQGIRVIKW